MNERTMQRLYHYHNLPQLLLVLIAVSPQAYSLRPNSLLRRSTTTRLFADAQSEIDALRAAAAKARQEAERLREELGQSPSAIAAPTLPQKSKEEVQTLVPTILAESDIVKQIELWKELQQSKSITAFGSANLQTFPVSLSVFEQRSGLTAATLGLEQSTVSLDDFKFATLYVVGGSTVAAVASLALLPPNIGATFCYLFALLPILFLGIGSTAPAAIANVIASVRSNDNANSSSNKATPSERVCRHEAAHFCCGYWCGLPVTGYSVISDNGVQSAKVEFGVASMKNYSPTEVAALAVTAVAGLVGEAQKWGNAEGATQDLLALEDVFRRSNEFIGAKAQQDLTRWGALTAALLLKQNEGKYEQVVNAFQRQASVEECISILESYESA